MKYFRRLHHLVARCKHQLILSLLLLLLTSANTAAQAALTPSQLDLALKRLEVPPISFMHHPFYGSQVIDTRITSYFDHDKPWYAPDRIFVRYDGKKWSGSSISVYNCDPGINCYDGHNGYDLNMRFEPVLSTTNGKVIRAGWYNALNHNDSFGLWAAIDHGNGFANVYGHLSALTVAVGDSVEAQWQIGTSGTTGSSTGPHLHFGTYYYPMWQATDPFGWTGHTADPNVVPDHALWNTGINDTPVPLLSSQARGTYPGATVVDDGDPGWSSTGTWQSSQASSDIGGKLHWTSTSSGQATASATWQASMPSNGYYEVGVFVDDSHASSGWAPYTVYSADPAKPGVTLKHLVQVDESHIGIFQSSFGQVITGSQWVGLGTYYFRKGQPARVVLSNATGESGLQIAADGVEFASLVPLNYTFTVSNDDTPSQMAPGSTNPVQLTIQNGGNFTWNTFGQNPVQVIYRWLDSQQKVVSTGQPVALPNNLATNATAPVSVQVQAPDQPGVYTLEWDLIQNKQPFSKLGAKAHDDSVNVDGSNVGNTG